MTSIPTDYPIIKPSKIKSYEDRKAELETYRNKVPKGIFYKMMRDMRQSAQDCGEIPLKKIEPPPTICSMDITTPPVIESPGHPTMEEIKQFVASQYKISIADLMTGARSKRPRKIAMYLCRELTKKSFTKIGAVFHRDHTSIIYSVRKTEALIETDKALADEVAMLSKALIG